MSTGQSIASPRAPRGQNRQPSASQPAHENNGRQSQRRSRGGRNHNNAAHPSPNKPHADPTLSEGGGPYTTDDARAPAGPRSGKKHMRGQPSHDRTSAAQTSLTDTEAAAHRTSATPLKNQAAYAGPTFHASPAPSALPIPKFLSRSVPAKTASGPPTPPPDNSSDSANSPSPSPSPSRAPIPIPARHEDSPLDMLFKADKAERAKHTAFSPIAYPARPPPQQQPPHEYSMFPIELEGETRNPHFSPPPFQSPAGHRSVTDPSNVPQLKDVQQPNNGNDVMQDLMNRLSMSQKKPAATMETPPRQAPQAPGNFQSPQHTPSPFNTGRPSVNRSVSGPSTPAQAPQDGPDFFYGNRNLSPMFKAAQGETPKRNSGLRTEVTADSPTVQQSMFQDFPSISSGNAIDPNTFSRGEPTSGAQGQANGRRGSVPYGQFQQRQPNKHVTQTPGRYQHRQDAHQRGRGNFHGPGPRQGRPAANPTPAAAPKPATTMMSFVPASVSAKPKAKPEQQLAASAPPSAALPPPKTSTPDTLALEQDLKRMLNLNVAGGVR